jgi:hypothetical protein
LAASAHARRTSRLDGAAGNQRRARSTSEQFDLTLFAVGKTLELAQRLNEAYDDRAVLLQSSIINRLKANLARLGIRSFRPNLAQPALGRLKPRTVMPPDAVRRLPEGAKSSHRKFGRSAKLRERFLQCLCCSEEPIQQGRLPNFGLCRVLLIASRHP